MDCPGTTLTAENGDVLCDLDSGVTPLPTITYETTATVGSQPAELPYTGIEVPAVEGLFVAVLLVMSGVGLLARQASNGQDR